MNRKILVFLLAPFIFAIVAFADAQQAGKVPRIGLLSPIARNRSAGSISRNPRSRAFEEGLRELGWIEGKNVTIERRGTGGKSDGLRESAADLVQLKVDVIVTRSTPPARAAKAATNTIPIVIIDPGDPVGIGLVDSLARGRQHHWVILDRTGFSCQTLGTAQRSISQGIPRSASL